MDASIDVATMTSATSAADDHPTIESLATRLVREAPNTAAAPELIAALNDVASVHAASAPLAIAIARIVEHVAAGRVAAGIALPALAMACSTLADGLAGRLGSRELEAARYEIDTLTPMARGTGPRLAVPDVSVVQLRKRSRD